MSNNESYSADIPQDGGMYDTNERMGGLSEKDYKGGSTPLDHTGNPEKYFLRNPDNPDVITKISAKDATKLILQGKGSQVIKSWNLAEDDDQS